MGEAKNKKDQLRHYMNVIERQAGDVVRPYREDGYVNVLNRYGTQRDSSEHYQYQGEPDVPDDQLIAFYEGNGLFGKVIDAPAEEAVKHGFEIDGLSNQSIEKFYKDALDELDWEEIAINAIKWTRLFGGAIAVMLIDDGGRLQDPLNWDNIRSIDDIRVYDRSIVYPDYSSIYSVNGYGDQNGKSYSKLGMPEYYDVYSAYGTFRVHESRCLVFRNGVLPERTANTIYRFWGIPEYIRIHRSIRDAEVAHGSAVKLLDRSIQAVYSMRGLANELATQGGEERVLKRLQTIDMARGLLNSITIDADGEDYSFRQFSYSGVSEVIDTTCNYVSALTNIPQTILFGRSPAGMNATGNGDLENWYNYVERIQKKVLKKNIRYLLNIIFQAAINIGEIDSEDVPKVNVKFNSLWSLTDTEQISLEQQKASVAQTKAQTAATYVDMQVLDPSEVRKKLAESDEFDVETLLDDYTEEELEENAPKQEGAEQGQMPQMPGMMGMGGGNAPDEAKTEANGGETKQVEEVAEDEEEINSVGILVVKDGRLLVAVRNGDDDSKGMIGGPGGKIEDGETSEQAAIRETQEEFGIVPVSLMSLGRGKKDEWGYTPEIFLCTEWKGVVKCLDDEMKSPKWSSLGNLLKQKDNLFPPFKRSISTMLHRVYDDHENNDGGKGSGFFGHSGRQGEIGGSSSSNGVIAVSDELKPRAEYKNAESSQEFIDKNIKKLKPIYDEEGMDGVINEYIRHRMDSSIGEFKQIDFGDAEDIVYENTGSAVSGWTLNGDSNYKPKLVEGITRSPEARNAALNVMYANYKDYFAKNGMEVLPYDEFLTTPVTMYRGGHGQEHVDSDWFSSYTFKVDIADDFAGKEGNVYVAKIRPIDTLGSVLRTGEYEVFVPRMIAPNGNVDEEEFGDDESNLSLITKLFELIKNRHKTAEKTEKHGIINTDGSSKSGNYGHYGRPGKVGGSSSVKLSAEEKLNFEKNFKRANKKRIKAVDKAFQKEAKAVKYSENDREKEAKLTAELNEAKQMQLEHEEAERLLKEAEERQKKGIVSATGINFFSHGIEGPDGRNLDSHWFGGFTIFGKPITSHKNEYKGFTKEQYGDMARALIESPVGGDILGHVTSDGYVVRFNKATGEFAKGQPHVGVATFFKAHYPENDGEPYDFEEAYDYYIRNLNRDLKNGGRNSD